MTPISEREIGVIEQKISNLEHRVRNDKTILNGLLDEIDSVRLELNQFKYRVYGVCSACVVFVGLVTWAFEMLHRGSGG